MRRRKLRWVLALAGLIAAGMVMSGCQPSRLTIENCDRIREGMTRAEVEAIVGVPPGDYRLRPPEDEQIDSNSTASFQKMQSSTRSFGETLERWRNDQVLLMVVFDSEGKVNHEIHGKPATSDAGPFESFLWRVKRHWQRWFP
jgi:outer membrane protein assembly factor BamE (lipoprotein component of BamABCDE complex)